MQPAIKQEIELKPEAAGAYEPLLVLKFGSSVLRGLEDLPRVAGEIYRQRRKGYRVIAVVSALAGETDRLFNEASEVADGINCAGQAELVSLGEERTAALVKLACDRIGIKSSICRVEELGLHTIGKETDADFLELESWALRQKLRFTGVVIVPGFVGLGENNERTLLGRGGTDFTAAILGGELGAEAVRLYKDVDGVFETDPAKAPDARKFEHVGYDDALRLAGQLVHGKAVAFAATRGLRIEVEALGSEEPTVIGPPSRFAPEKPSARPLRIALAGYGVVGQALCRRLKADPRFEVSSILVRDIARQREVDPPAPLTRDLERFVQEPADVFVELLSCDATGAAICSVKLEEGIPVITASKRVIADHLKSLSEDARRGGTRLYNSATVGGGVPILETIDRVRSHGAISNVSAILNGTVNFVLERIYEGMALKPALELARRRGFAEEDSEADVSGADAAAKLKIIAGRAFGVDPRAVVVDAERLDERPASLIKAPGKRWVQLSSVRKAESSIVASVEFCPIDTAPITEVGEEWNMARIELVDGREYEVFGRGAGGPATAEAVLADLYDLLEQRDQQSAQCFPDQVTVPGIAQGHRALA